MAADGENAAMRMAVFVRVLAVIVGMCVAVGMVVVVRHARFTTRAAAQAAP